MAILADIIEGRGGVQKIGRAAISEEAGGVDEDLPDEQHDALEGLQCDHGSHELR